MDSTGSRSAARTRPADRRSGAATLALVFRDTAGAYDELSPDRAWWLRVPATLVSPRPVFFALREEDPDDVVARSEPILLLVWLAGAASVLASPRASVLLDNPNYDAPMFAVWTFIAGGIYGAVGYFVIGFSLFFGARLLGSLGTFRRERQLVAFAAVPLAASLLLAAAPTPGALRRGHLPRRRLGRGGGGERSARDPARLRRVVARVARPRRAGRPRLELAALARGGRRRLRRCSRPWSAYSRSLLDDARARPAACSKSASSSSGIEYVCCSSGKRRSRTSAAKISSAFLIVVPISA